MREGEGWFRMSSLRSFWAFAIDFIQHLKSLGSEYVLVIVCRWTKGFPYERASVVCGWKKWSNFIFLTWGFLPSCQRVKELISLEQLQTNFIACINPETWKIEKVILWSWNCSPELSEIFNLLQTWPAVPALAMGAMQCSPWSSHILSL